jgi:hypothetical protein
LGIDLLDCRDRCTIYLGVGLYIVEKLLKGRANCVEKHIF